jgi:hypothetical protein
MKGINSKKKGAKEEGAKTIFDFRNKKPALLLISGRALGRI